MTDQPAVGQTAPALTIVRPGEGGEGFLGSIGVAFKLWGENTYWCSLGRPGSFDGRNPAGASGDSENTCPRAFR